jgi:hypothetical protein
MQVQLRVNLEQHPAFRPGSRKVHFLFEVRRKVGAKNRMTAEKSLKC